MSKTISGNMAVFCGVLFTELHRWLAADDSRQYMVLISATNRTVNVRLREDTYAVERMLSIVEIGCIHDPVHLHYYTWTTMLRALAEYKRLHSTVAETLVDHQGVRQRR